MNFESQLQCYIRGPNRSHLKLIPLSVKAGLPTQPNIPFPKRSTTLTNQIHIVPQSTDILFSTRYSVMCKVYTGYCGTTEIEHGLCACTVDNPFAKARGLSLRTGAQPCSISHLFA